MPRRFEINPRPKEIGGGWDLRMLEEQADGVETEMGGGAFPAETEAAETDAYSDALNVGEDWVNSMGEASGSQKGEGNCDGSCANGQSHENH